MPAPVDVTTLCRRLRDAAPGFAAAAPVPHVVLDDALDPALLDAIHAEFDAPRVGWKTYHHPSSRKRVASDTATMGPTCRALLDALRAPDVLRALEALADVPGLVGDPALDGAGLHETLPGGHLGVHVDHLAHTTERAWSRQLNLLLFLNRDWEAAWGGALEFWDRTAARCERRIAPTFNRCVVFRTLPGSFHGVPDPVACPPGRARRSLALYYFHDEGRPLPLQPTRYVARPDDPPLRKALVELERWALAGYAVVKRYTPLDDARVARLLRRL